MYWAMGSRRSMRSEVETENFYQMKDAGRILIILGILATLAGLILYLAGNSLKWIGHLPGDIRIERENFRFYFPVTTLILFSLIINLIILLIKKWM